VINDKKSVFFRRQQSCELKNGSELHCYLVRTVTEKQCECHKKESE